MKNEDAEASEKAEDATKSLMGAATVTEKDNEIEDRSEDKAPTELEPDEEEEEEVDFTRRVMFQTDDWEKCITEAVWFGQKIPQKRRGMSRSVIA